MLRWANLVQYKFGVLASLSSESVRATENHLSLSRHLQPRDESRGASHVWAFWLAPGGGGALVS